MYERIYEFENMYEAHRKARKCKRDKKEIIEYEMDLSQNLCRLQRELKSKTYRISNYREFTIYDPKKRSIQALAYRDRIVQHSLCDNIIEPYMERHLIYDNAAGRIGKGTHFAMDRLSTFMRKYYKKYGNSGYILKFDIRKFYDNVDHEILYQLYDKAFGEDRNLMWLIRRIIDSYESTKGKGLPLGNQTSTWFALYYLDGLDRLVKEKLRLKYYTRYMDDGVVIHNDKEYLKKCLRDMEEYIAANRKMCFNEKTQIVPISQGVDYLGFHFYLTDTGKVIRRLRTSNKKRMKRKMKSFRHAYRDGKVTMETVTQSVNSYCGHLRHGHTYKLRKNILDKLVLTKGKGEEFNEETF